MPDRPGCGPTVAVLSGKGGTGKTLVAVNLAAAAGTCTYLDCDAEEPDGLLYFPVTDGKTRPVLSMVPEIDASRCTQCRRCVEFCAFHALASIGKSIMVFPEVCHACGGCVIVCPEKAISETQRHVGDITTGRSGSVTVICGAMEIGQSSPMPVLREQFALPRTGTAIVDGPPGSGCAAAETVRKADLCLLVAEPTVFGARNMAMVHRLAVKLGKRCAAVLNKCDGKNADNPSARYCRKERIPVVGTIDFDPALARLHGSGKIAVRESERYRDLFSALYENVMKESAR